MTRRIVQAIRHIGFEDLGSFAAPLREAGYDIDYIDVAERDLAMLDPLGADLVVVFGGPIVTNYPYFLATRVGSCTARR
jgi:GMP synthase (glutamine-hydrolysing)